MKQQRSGFAWYAVLHGSFALTAVFHAIGGPLLPSLSAHLHLSDSQAGRLFFFYFLGSSIGALLCAGRYARLMRIGFAVTAGAALAIVFAQGSLSFPLFLVLGVGVGIPMSAVSMIAGQRFGEHSAAPLTLLNFSWSAGALLAPLVAAPLLIHRTYRAAYLVLAAAALAAALACSIVLRDPAETIQKEAAQEQQSSSLRWIILFALLTFLQVGIENTSITWLATYALRTAAHGAAVAAASSSVYWIGFLVGRGVSSWALVRIAPFRLLIVALGTALIGSTLLIAAPVDPFQTIGMALLGAALGPIFPLLLSLFFARVPKTSDSRWVLACCGFGGSVVPWFTGAISAHFGDLRLALAIVPAALLLMLALAPTIRPRRPALS